MGSENWGLGYGNWDFRTGILRLWSENWDWYLGSWIWDLGNGVWDLGCLIWDLGSGNWGLGSGDRASRLQAEEEWAFGERDAAF